jgi:hypothetical protein
MKKMMFTTAVLAAAMAFSCNDKGVLEPKNYPDFVVIDGDTVKTRDDKNLQKQIGEKKHSIFNYQYPVVGDTVITWKDIKLIKPANVAKLENIKNQTDPSLKGKPLKMVVIGGTLASGFRDGGWFNEGMITSYPNIIANQMGISFDLPLFDANDYNGAERKAFSNFNPTGGPLPKIKNVVNNSGIDLSTQNWKAKAFVRNTDSYVKPLGRNYERIGKADQRNGSNKVVFYNELKKGRAYDFFIFEPEGLGIFYLTPASLIGQISNVNELSLQSLKERNWEKYPEEGFYSREDGMASFMQQPHLDDNLVRRLSNEKMNKGVIINSPDLFKYSGYYNRNYKEELLKIFSTYQLSELYMDDGDYLNQYLGYRLPTPGERNVYGTASLDSILGKNVNINLKPGVSVKYPIKSNVGLLVGDISEPSKNVEAYNKSLSVYSEYLNVPLFDLNALYRKIWEGSYITDDGIKVNGKWPEGNFYSVDGLYPSAFGQAVIANEIIKFINSQYKTDIPIINTNDFLNY